VLRPEGPKRQQLEQAFGDPPFGFLQQRQTARFDDFLDLAGEIPADAVQLREVLSGGNERRDLVREVADHACSITICTHAKRVRALDFEEISETIEDPRHVGVVNRHLTACMLP
jgi:hypothetical protein